MSVTSPSLNGAAPATPAVLKKPAAPPITYKFKPGDTVSQVVFDRMPGATLQEKMKKTAEVLKMNGLTWGSAKTMQSNFELKLPADLAKDQAKPAASADTPAAAEVSATPSTAQTPLGESTGLPVGTQPVNTLGNVGGNLAANTTPATANASGLGTTRQNDQSKITVAQLDTFFTDNTGFNHGRDIAATIRQGGATPQLAGDIDLLQYRVDGNGPLAATMANNTANALQDVVKRVKNGQDIDAVNMSLQDFNPSAGAGQVRSLVQQLIQMNVPVLVAAGNAGPQMVNQLTTPSALVVQSATNGRRNANSGIGSIQGESSSTSFATAGLSPRIAAMANSGMTVQQIKALME
jgi:hypothetical protein